MDDLRVSPRIVIPAADLSFTAVRASGAGGQNVNKVSSKVDLRFDLRSTAALTETVKQRLRTLANVDAEGRVIVVSQVTRDQGRNLEDARQKLATLIRAALVVPKKRRATKPTKGSQRRRVDEKKRRGREKLNRRRVDSE